jgi:hypothetical protein
VGVTTVDACEITRPLAREKLKGRVALVRGGTLVVGMVIGRSLACRLGRRDGVARVAHFLCAEAYAVTTGRVWAVTGGQEV